MIDHFVRWNSNSLQRLGRRRDCGVLSLMESSRYMVNSDNLIDLMRDQFAASKRLVRFSILCNVAVVLFSIIDSVKALNFGSGSFPIVMFLLQISAFFLREKSAHDYSFAEDIRRLALWHDGLDVQVTELHLKRISLQVGNSGVKDPPFIGL